MLTKDLLQETYLAIKSNKARSVLTILGIVIGIASVISMISIGQGASASITSSIESGGANLLTISPGQQKGFGPVKQGQGSADSLTNDDAEALTELENITGIAPAVSSRYQASVKENNTNTSIYGVTSDYFKVNEIDMTLGSVISDSNVKSSSKIAVLGATVAEDLYGEDVDPIGQSIKINNMNFKVIGVMESTGSSFNSSDDNIFIPLTVFQRYFSGDEYLSSIIVKIDSQENMDQAKEDAFNAVLASHDLETEDEADFNVRGSDEMMEMATSVTSTLTILLGAIAGISLVVGGIGIMNMMLTTVTERTKEIGLRKAIGAKAKNITMQFLAESVMLTFFGGVIGIIIGWAVAWVTTNIFNVATSVSTYSIVLAFGVSVAIGIIFGYYPARKAAKMNPIDALRYE